MLFALQVLIENAPTPLAMQVKFLNAAPLFGGLVGNNLGKHQTRAEQHRDEEALKPTTPEEAPMESSMTVLVVSRKSATQTTKTKISQDHRIRIKTTGVEKKGLPSMWGMLKHLPSHQAIHPLA